MASIKPPGGFTTEDTEKRKKWLKEKTGFCLDHIEPDEPENLKGIIENHVGYISIPMAIAGPLMIDGSYAQGEFYVPLCTLEGTLALSMTRGFYLTYLCGGIKTKHIKQEMSRSPIFAFDDIEASDKFLDWLNENFDQIKAAAESTTSHGKLLRIDKYVAHNNVILDFVYFTAEACGQNMTTIATSAACRFIKEKYKGNKFQYQIECNFNCDKNPAIKTIIHGRGHQVIASTLIQARLLKRVMRTEAERWMEAFNQMILGSQMAGVVGMNSHVANALAALYLSTGQDVACVAENAVGMIRYERRNDGLYATLTMPSISVGTVGGGTRLKQQRKNLEMLGCTGKNSSKKLAEIVCASALALELSLGGAIASDEFAQSHAHYGRR
ncbi:MAG: hydroxymethylglutaryl-CoA reductase [bacterium]